jgi:hypothetical protein
MTTAREQHLPLLEQVEVNATAWGYSPYDEIITKLVAKEVYLKGATPGLTTLCREHDGPRAVLNALERLARGYGSECDRSSETSKSRKHSFRDYRPAWSNPLRL